MKVRKSVFSGSWYPSGADDCEKEIAQFLAGKEVICPEKNITGCIVPHAGWYFSGSIACNVINCLKKESPPDVIFIFGMHLHPGSSPHIMVEGSWDTPFGKLPVAKDIASDLADQFNFMVETAGDYTPDNTIELQLPFIKYMFDNVKIVPVGVPPSDLSIAIGTSAAEIAKKQKIHAKVIGSTDLTHYGSNYGFSPKGSGDNAHEWVRSENDRSIIDAMLRMDPEEVLAQAENKHNACCSGAVAAALAAAKTLGAKEADSVAYTTSYEKSPGESFVGYAGIVF